MSGAMTYSVIGYGHRSNVVPAPSLKSLRNVHQTLGAALDLLPDDSEFDAALPPEYAYNLDHLTTLLERVPDLVPDIADVWLCGYTWGRGFSPEYEPHFTCWSGHPSRKIAERWLEAWKQSQISHRRDTWEVRQGTCALGRFMPKGTRIDTVMKKVRGSR